MTEDLAVGCAVINSANVCSSALASEGLVVENVTGVVNVYDGSSIVAISVAGNRGDPDLGVVAAGDNKNICATVDGLVEPILVNCDDEHLASPLAAVPVVPEVAALSLDILGTCKVALGQSGLPPPANLEGKADIVNIPISVVSNGELKSCMAWSMNNSVLVQSNWLDIDESFSTPSTEDSDNFGVHVNDDMYSFMIGCVVDQAVLNGVGKKNEKVNLKRNNCLFSRGLLMLWVLLDVGNDEVVPYNFPCWHGIVGNLGGLSLSGWLSAMDGPSLAALVWLGAANPEPFYSLALTSFDP